MANKKDCDLQLEKIYIIHYRCMSATFHSTLVKARDDFALKMLQKFLFNNIQHVTDCKQMWL